MTRQLINRHVGLAALLLVLISPPSSHAQIKWRSGAVPRQVKSLDEQWATIGDPRLRSEKRHIMLQFNRPLTQKDRADLDAGGVRVLGYLGDQAYFAAVDPNRLNRQTVEGLGVVSDARELSTDWKLHPMLQRGEQPTWAIVPARQVGPPKVWIAAYVMFHPDVGAVESTQAVRKHQAVIVNRLQSINGAVIELPQDAVVQLAAEDAVQYVEPALPPMGSVNNSNRTITQADIVQAPPYSLDGSAVSVMVYDGGAARASHVDFGGRLTTRDGSPLSNHATHVSGTIGGDGTASGGTWRGMAPGVTIESYGFEQAGGLQPGFLYTDPGDLETDYGDAINNYGAVLANNSIGTNTAPNGFPCSWEGDYGVTSALIDSVVRGGLGAPIRIVWANGNERSSGRCGTTYHTTAPPACAKNHITVGALNSNDDSVTFFTSWGPTDDDRLKPDVSAPGCQVGGDGGVTSCSSASDTAYTVFCGTSMAAPSVTGLSALLLEDYRAQFPGAPDFSNATLKSLLAHNAQDIEEVGPDYKSGYGSVRIQQTIDFMRTGNFFEDQVDQGIGQTILVVIGPQDTQLKATLAWDDPPAVPNVNPALVNDLDLRVFDPSGAQHFPWTLGGLANPSAPAVRTQADHVNNIEQVLVDAPTPGVWTIEVFGFNVPQGPQSYSLCISPSFVGDCNRNGVNDADDVAGGTSEDCNANLVPDECEPSEDCNSNGVRDICDIGAGFADINSNNILDVCEPDCNSNAIPDAFEISTGATPDCNDNAVPDECDLAQGTSGDCDTNGVPDECDPDCNNNGVADGCDISGGTSMDCGGEGVPDECESDCNNNGIADACDIASSHSQDIDGNGFPDECAKLFVDADATGIGDGSNWLNAYPSLQDALTFAAANVQISEVWVATGTYTPANTNGDRNATFQLRNNLALYGGFAGWESSVSQRDPVVNETILSGDLNGDDPPGWGNMGENSYHVVTAINISASAVLDGFTVKRGWSWQSTGVNSGGAGIYLSSASPLIVRCKITENLAHFGAGMISLDSSPTIRQCSFIGNLASDGRGGAIYCSSSLPNTVFIEGCQFLNNEATVAANSGAGGAIYSSFDTVLDIQDSLFEGNVARWRFTAASFDAPGGAILSQTDGSHIKRCIFRSNRAHTGGAIWIGGDMMVDNCLFVDNEAFRQSNGAFDFGGFGGAVYTFLGHMDIDRSTFYANFAPSFGGVYAGGGADVTNSILWGNLSTEIAAPIRDYNLAGIFNVTYSCVEGLLTPEPGEDPPDPNAYPTVIVVDPLWIDADGADNIPGTVDDDLRLSPTSPAIDTGDPTYSGDGAVDLDTKPRVLCGIVDMGAYETSTGDYTCNQAPDPTNFANWTACMTSPAATTVWPDCDVYDFDLDNDVDLVDFAHFQSIFISGVPFLDPPATITGQVSYGGAAMGPIHVTATQVEDSAFVYTTTINAPGPYSIDVLLAGTYTLTAYLDANSNGQQEPTEPVAIYPANPVAVASAGQVVGGIDLSLAGTFDISGTVLTSGGSPSFGVTMTLTGAQGGSTTSDGSGQYTFTNLAEGAYTVTPTHASRYFYPFDATVNLSGANATGVDFVSHNFPAGEVDSEVMGAVTAVDVAGFNLTVDVAGSPQTFFVYAGTIFGGDASKLDEVQVGWTATVQYYSSANLAAEVDAASGN